MDIVDGSGFWWVTSGFCSVTAQVFTVEGDGRSFSADDLTRAFSVDNRTYQASDADNRTFSAQMSDWV